MKKTHLSLYYLVGYLIPGGVALIIAPQWALKLLFSTGNYGDVLPRLVGVILLALGMVILQIVRLHVDVLYRDRKSTRLNSSHIQKSRMPSSA